MKKISFRQLENLVLKLRSLDSSLCPSIYHKGYFYGVRVRGIFINSEVLETIRSCFKSSVSYFVERDMFNVEYFLFSFNALYFK